MKSKTVQEFKETEIGKIPIDWNIEKLEDVIETILDRRGITPKKLNSDWVKKGWSVISAKNIKEGKLIRKEIIRFVDHTTYEKWMSKKIKEGDILLTSEGPLGELYHVKDFKEFCIGQRLFAIRCNAKKISDNFLFFYLFSIKGQQELSSRATGTTVSGIRQEELRKILICFPKKLNEQQKIGKILLDLHTKIDNLQNQNRILEQIAQAIFKSWFVDFDGVTEFEDSELGKIPKEWSVKPLSEIMTLITKGTTPTQKEIKSCINNENYVNYLRVQSIGDDDDIDFKKLLVIPESIHSNSLKRSILQKDDIIYTIAGTIGRISIVESNLLPCNTNQAIAILRLKNSTLKNFVFYYMKQKMYRDELHKNIVHAVQANLSLGMISNSKIILPPNYILEKLLLHIDKISQQLKCNRNMIQSLTKTRDTLLPKLMSGEIRV